MQIKKTKHSIEVHGIDINGKFLIRIICTIKNHSQVQIETEDDNAYFNVNYQELKTIRDAITEVLDGFDNHVA